jgi:hypothetical protein
MGRDSSPAGAELQAELEARSNCRYGLRGVPIRVRGHGGTFVVFSTRWDAGRRLAVTAYPAGRDGFPVWKCTDTDNHKWTHTMACWNPAFPDGTLFNVPASDCILTGPWPVVCCRPSRRRRGTGR